jgi:hypothetical protein
MDEKKLICTWCATTYTEGERCTKCDVLLIEQPTIQPLPIAVTIVVGAVVLFSSGLALAWW